MPNAIKNMLKKKKYIHINLKSIPVLLRNKKEQRRHPYQHLLSIHFAVEHTAWDGYSSLLNHQWWVRTLNFNRHVTERSINLCSIKTPLSTDLSRKSCSILFLSVASDGGVCLHCTLTNVTLEGATWRFF
jgi:hypothetical protein